MSRLEEIKNEYALMMLYPNWDVFISDMPIYQREEHYDEITLIYAQECSRASLEKASKKAKMYKESCGIPSECGCMGNCDYPISYINKKSITNPDNIVLL